MNSKFKVSTLGAGNVSKNHFGVEKLSFRPAKDIIRIRKISRSRRKIKQVENWPWPPYAHGQKNSIFFPAISIVSKRAFEQALINFCSYNGLRDIQRPQKNYRVGHGTPEVGSPVSRVPILRWGCITAQKKAFFRRIIFHGKKIENFFLSTRGAHGRRLFFERTLF